MNWFLASAAPVIVGIILMGSGLIPPAILAYHLLCAVAVYRHRARIRTFLRGDRTTVWWALGTTLVIVGVLLAAPLIHDPEAKERATLRFGAFDQRSATGS